MSDYIDYSDRTIAGLCPMGCGPTLFARAGGHITCSALECPNPTAVDQILADPQMGHIVRTDEFDFALQHPLSERIGQTLFDCELNRFLTGLATSPQPPGFYYVTGAGDDWFWKFLKPY